MKSIGLVCTEILITLHVGCGLTRHNFAKVVVTGLQENLTTTRDSVKTAERCGLRVSDGGTMKIVPRQNAATSAKRRVGTIPSLTTLSLNLTINVTEKITSL